MLLETLMEFRLCLKGPDGARRAVAQFGHHNEGIVSINSAGVKEDFSIVGIKLVQRQTGFHCIGVAAESGKGAKELKTAHAPYFGVCCLVESPLQERERFFELPHLRQGLTQQAVELGQARLELACSPHFTNRQLKFSLLEVNYGQTCVHFCDVGLEL